MPRLVLADGLEDFDGTAGWNLVIDNKLAAGTERMGLRVVELVVGKDRAATVDRVRLGPV